MERRDSRHLLELCFEKCELSSGNDMTEWRVGIGTLEASCTAGSLWATEKVVHLAVETVLVASSSYCKGLD